MPTYRFSCKRCGQEFRIRTTIRDKEERRIPWPACGSKDLKQLLTGQIHLNYRINPTKG